MKKLMLVFLLSLSLPVYAYGPYDATLDRVIDGDTVKMYLAIYPDVVVHVSVRVAGVDTPETSKRYNPCQIPMGLAAKKYTGDWFKGATHVKVSGVKLGSYVHRAIGVITANKGGTTHNLGNDLLSSGHARAEVVGNVGKGWCN